MADDRVAVWIEQDRRELFEQTAAQRGLTPVIVEKDYWVFWTLGLLFTAPLGKNVVFKGGTSLSKVHHLISRFSEDIDLCVERQAIALGADSDPYEAKSGGERTRRVAHVSHACHAWVNSTLRPQLLTDAESALGAGLVRIVVDEKDPGTLFLHYPRALTPATYGATDYVDPAIRLELGARGDPSPAAPGTVRALCAEAFPESVRDVDAPVMALAATRTFWEKVVLAHSEHHRPLEKPITPHLARHYYDLAMLRQRGTAVAALGDAVLLAEVVRNTSTFFRTGWGNYETATRGHLRITPAPERIAALKRDYTAMEPMFFDTPPKFETLLEELTKLETELNAV